MAKGIPRFSMRDNYQTIWRCFFLLWISVSCHLAQAESEVKLNPTEVEKEVLDLINAERQKNGLHPLAWESQLYDAARGHSEEMASENFFSHTSLNGRDFTDRIKEAGYDDSVVSENIGAGQSTAQQVFDGWMTSDGHRENMLDEAYCDAAVGHMMNEESDWTHYWTINIGRKNGIDQCPGPEPATESEPEPDPDPEADPAPEPEFVVDEPDFCAKLIRRHVNFCKGHPDLCRAALNKCRKSRE